MVPRMSAPASTTTRVPPLLFQFGVATEIENDSGSFKGAGRTDSEIFDCSPITIVTGPASSSRVMTLGLLPNTFWKSVARSSIACWMGIAASALRRRVTAELSTIEFLLTDSKWRGFVSATCAAVSPRSQHASANNTIENLASQAARGIAEVLDPRLHTAKRISLTLKQNARVLPLVIRRSCGYIGFE